MSCCPTIVNVPGPRGQAGTNGTNGIDGKNAFCYTTAQFQVPAYGAWVLVMVDSTDFLPESVAGQFFVSIQGCGYMQVMSVDGLQLTLQNPAVGVLGIPNAVPTTVIPIGSLITLAGAIGPTGATGAAGGAGFGESYVCRTTPTTLTNATVLESLSSGYMKTLGSSGAGAVFTASTVPVGDISGVVPVNKGGTNQALAPAGNEVISGDGASNTVYKEITGTLPIVITAGASTINVSAPSVVAFSYVTFTRRVSGTGASAPQIAAGQTKNPYSTTAFGSASYSGIDTASGFDAPSGKFTVPYAGYYRIDAMFSLIALSATSDVSFILRKNGSNVISTYTADVKTAGYHPLSISYIDQASASDYYEVYVTANANAVTVDQGSSFSVQRIQA